MSGENLVNVLFFRLADAGRAVAHWTTLREQLLEKKFKMLMCTAEYDTHLIRPLLTLYC